MYSCPPIAPGPIRAPKDRSRLDGDKVPAPAPAPFAAHQTPPDFIAASSGQDMGLAPCLGNFAPVPSAHSRYPQYFGCGQVLHISDHRNLHDYAIPPI